MWALLAYGLYFANHLYSFAIILAAVVGVMMIYERIRGIKATIPMWLVPLPFLYVLPILFGRAESIQASMNQMLVMSVFVFISYLLLKLKQGKNGDRKLQQIVIAISWMTLILSYAVLLQVFSLSEFIMKLSGAVSGLGARLGGFVQYPNAFASLLASMILFHLVVSTREERVKGFLLQTTLLPGLFSLLLLTESRGAWLLFIIVYMISVVMVKLERRFHYLLLSAYIFVSGGILYLSFVGDGSIYASWHTVLLLLVFAGLLYFLQPGKWDKLQQLQRFGKFVPYIVPVLTILLALDVFFKGAVYHILPASLQNRLSFGTGTLTDRMYYWSDVWNNIDAIGLLGRGGDGWKYMMYQIQSFPYVTSEIHNSLLDLFIEIGIIGLVFCIVLLVFAFRNLWRSHSTVFPAFLFLVLHSLIDFTFSYPVMILWLLLLYVAGHESIQSVQKRTNVTYLPTIIVAILIVATIFLSTKFMKAEQSFQAAFSASSNEEASYYIQTAVEQNPWRTTYSSMAVEQGLLTIEESRLQLERALKYEPRNARLHYQLAEVYKELGNDKKTETHYDLMLKYDRFDTEKYKAALAYYEQKIKQASQSNDTKQLTKAKQKETKISKIKAQLTKDIKTKELTNQRKFE